MAKTTNTTGRAPATWTQKALVGILGIAVLGSTLALTAQRRSDDYALLDPIIDVMALIRRYAAVAPEDDALQRAAIEGMLEELDDDYAVYVPPALEEAFNTGLTGEYVGIGAEVIARDTYLEIVTPLDDSPAFKAGLMTGDRVLEIDGEPTAGKSTDEAVDFIKGEPGSEVILTIERNGEISDITVERGNIVQRSVRGFAREADDASRWRYLIDRDRRIAYVRLGQFAPASFGELRDALRRVRAQQGDLGGLVLDLRFNPGGLLSTAIDMADLFIEDGVIVSTRGRAFDEEIAEAKEAGTLPDFPLIVMVNGSSASASEVLSGALVESDRARVLGTRSFGKGSVQSVRPLSGAAAGAVLKLTEQLYYLPSGRSIQRLEGAAEWGVDPSPGFFVPMTDDQTRAMLNFRREQEIIRGAVQDEGASSDWSNPDWIESTASDLQLAQAMRAMRSRIDSGEWVPPSDAQLGYDPAVADEIARARLTRDRLLRELERIDRRVAALESADADAAANASSDRDLWADDVSVEDGELIVYDAQGNEVARLTIDNPNLERWLIDAGVRKAGGDQDNNNE